jgi:hypothetical protein
VGCDFSVGHPDATLPEVHLRLLARLGLEVHRRARLAGGDAEGPNERQHLLRRARVREVGHQLAIEDRAVVVDFRGARCQPRRVRIEPRFAGPRRPGLIAAPGSPGPDRLPIDAVFNSQPFDLLTAPEPGQELFEDYRFQHGRDLPRAKPEPSYRHVIPVFHTTLPKRRWGISDVGKSGI